MKHFLNVVLPILIIAVSVAWTGYNFGYHRGVGAGVVGTLDTVNVILGKQLLSDTSRTELIIAEPTNTTVYFLSRKTVLPK